MKILKIYDNGGRTADRYTVVTDTKQGEFNECLGLSSNPNHPLGVAMWGTCVIGDHLGEEISFEDLPMTVKKYLKEVLNE